MSDLAALRQANLAITMQSSTQAALSVADIVLLKDSPNVLSDVLYKGQRIVNGLLDVLKLQLSQVFYLALLIVAIRLVASGFPYVSMQGTVIVIVTITLPSIGLSLWAAAGVLPTARLTRILAHFLAPAAITMSAAGLIAYLYFLEMTHQIEYAQLALTWTLVLAGLVLVLFVKPPLHIYWRFSLRRGDLRPTILVVILLALFFLVTSIPLAQDLLHVTWLHSATHYLYIGVLVLGWAFTLRLVWLALPLVRMPTR
jgi:cation-transporting ATPase E